METETILILLFSIAVAVAIAVRQLHVPYTVALVLTGLGLGILSLFTPPHLTKELLFSVFLPGLLFEAAFHIEFSDFWRNRLAIASLAVPGVAAAVALTTVILPPVVNGLNLEQGFTWLYALVFGALIAATDPIAVVAAQESQWARRHLLLTEKNHVIDSYRQGVLTQEVYEKLLADIDARLLRLESGDDAKAPPK